MRLIDIATAVTFILKQKTDELTAVTLLEESLRLLNAFSDPHWRASNIAEVPTMIRELARDRDDFKSMSIAYREKLANAEDEIRKLRAVLAGENKTIVMS
jgi:hypothetical protein